MASFSKKTNDAWEYILEAFHNKYKTNNWIIVPGSLGRFILTPNIPPKICHTKDGNPFDQIIVNWNISDEKYIYIFSLANRPVGDASDSLSACDLVDEIYTMCPELNRLFALSAFLAARRSNTNPQRLIVNLVDWDQCIVCLWLTVHKNNRPVSNNITVHVTPDATYTLSFSLCNSTTNEIVQVHDDQCNKRPTHLSGKNLETPADVIDLLYHLYNLS
jgi:hypothetical protein